MQMHGGPEGLHTVDHEGPSQDLGIGLESKPGIVFTTYLDLVTLTMRKLMKTLT